MLWTTSQPKRHDLPTGTACFHDTTKLTTPGRRHNYYDNTPEKNKELELAMRSTGPLAQVTVYIGPIPQMSRKVMVQPKRLSSSSVFYKNIML